MRSKRKREKQDDILEYDFHGLTSTEAEEYLLRILDDHEGKGGLKIDIIHGTGTGVLASAVERIAFSDARVKNFERGVLNPGVTSVVLSGGKENRHPKKSRSEWDSIPVPAIRRRKR